MLTSQSWIRPSPAGEHGLLKFWHVDTARCLAVCSQAMQHSTTSNSNGNSTATAEAAGEAGALTDVLMVKGGPRAGALCTTADSRVLLFQPDQVCFGICVCVTVSVHDVGVRHSHRTTFRCTLLIGYCPMRIAHWLLLPQASPGTPPRVAVQLVGNIDQVTDLRALCCTPTDPTAVAPSHLAVATNSAQVHVFEVATRGCVASLTGHAGAVLALDVLSSQGGEPMVLATGSKDNGVRLWTVPQVCNCIQY